MVHKLTKEDWERVLSTMTRYNRESGFVNILEDKLTFFDRNATIDGVDSFYVTQSDVRVFISLF